MAQPNIRGEVCRRICLFCSRGNADKEYVIVVSRDDIGHHVTALCGPLGRLKNGQRKNAAPFASLAGAQRMAEALITEKAKKGYEIVADVSPSTASAPPRRRPRPGLDCPPPTWMRRRSPVVAGFPFDFP
jgi:predicted DNA-binding WGR domain protein